VNGIENEEHKDEKANFPTIFRCIENRFIVSDGVVGSGLGKYHNSSKIFLSKFCS
jgi:hypothetical protein